MGLSSGRRFAWFIVVACVATAATVLVSKRVVAAQDERAAESGHAELVRQQELARKEGIPLTVAEFAPNPPIPDSKNAAPLYHKVYKLLGAAEKKSGFKGFDLLRPAKPEGIAADRTFLVQAQPALSIAAEAAKRPECDLKFKNSLSSGFSFTTFAEFKFIAKVAVGEAALEVHDGQPVNALKTVAKHAPICGHLAQSHSMLATLVDMSIDAIFIREIADILSRYGSNPGVDEAAISALAVLGPWPNLVRVEEAENLSRLDGLSPQTFQDASGSAVDSSFASADQNATAEEKAQASAMKRVIELAKRPGVADRWRALEIESTRRYVALLKSAGDDWFATETAANSIDESLTRPMDDDHAWLQFAGYVSWPRALDSIALQLSNRRVLAQSAAALQVYLRTHRFPTKLPLTGEAARDPFGKGPLHYKRTANGFTIYGVGPHGVDHGGKLRDSKSGVSDYDVVFTYPASPLVVPTKS